MGMGMVAIVEGLKQGVFPWGYAIKTSPNHHKYFINARKFAEIERIDLGLDKNSDDTKMILKSEDNL